MHYGGPEGQVSQKPWESEVFRPLQKPPLLSVAASTNPLGSLPRDVPLLRHLVSPSWSIALPAPADCCDSIASLTHLATVHVSVQSPLCRSQQRLKLASLPHEGALSVCRSLHLQQAGEGSDFATVPARSLLPPTQRRSWTPASWGTMHHRQAPGRCSSRPVLSCGK